MEFGSIEECSSISSRFFKNHFLKKNVPLKISGFLNECPDVFRWDFDYLEGILGERNVRLKRFLESGDVELCESNFGDYISSIKRYELNKGDKDVERPLYCHDVPIFHMAPDLISDVLAVKKDFFPSVYREAWWKYAQFFMSPSGSVTPLHFDTLRTHNLFFQVHGTKEFILMPESEMDFCYRSGWRWFLVDPKNPDDSKFPKFKCAQATKVTLKKGDVLFMPSGTLHHVTTTEASISFNVDFHTLGSALRSFQYATGGMPKESLYYNTILLMSLFSSSESKFLFERYKPYLNYVS